MGDYRNIKKVVRITKTLFIFDNDIRIGRRDGVAPGAGYFRTTISEPTPEIRNEIRERKLRYALNKIVADESVSVDTLNVMYRAYINAHTKA